MICSIAFLFWEVHSCIDLFMFLYFYLSSKLNSFKNCLTQGLFTLWSEWGCFFRLRSRLVNNIILFKMIQEQKPRLH